MTPDGAVFDGNLELHCAVRPSRFGAPLRHHQTEPAGDVEPGSGQHVTTVYTADGYVQTYRVRDRIPLGACHSADTVCGAAAGSNGAGEVIAEARQFPWARLRSVVAFYEIDGDTGIVERMQIQAPRLLAAVTVREAVDAHTEMLANIRRHFAR